MYSISVCSQVAANNNKLRTATERKVLSGGLTCGPLTQEVDECIVVHRVELDQVLHRVATEAELVPMLFWYPRHTMSKGVPSRHRAMYPC